MAMPRFHLDARLAVGDLLRLPEDVAHHARRVLRLPAQARIVLFDGRGGEYPATLHLDVDGAQAHIDAFDPVERESPLELTLLQALVSAEKLDLIVEKAVELGVARILVVPMRRGVVRLDAERGARRLQHWRDVVRVACCQCGRNRLPAVEFHGGFDSALAAVAADSLRLQLLPSATASLPGRLPVGRVAVLVGPEGGFSDDETQRAGRAGFVAVRLGPRILRTETAGLAALAALQALGGDFGAAI